MNDNRGEEFEASKRYFKAEIQDTIFWALINLLVLANSLIILPLQDPDPPGKMTWLIIKVAVLVIAIAVLNIAYFKRRIYNLGKANQGR